MDEITHEVCLANWKKIISQCENQKEGISAKQWMLNNNIPRDHYYWLWSVRKEVFYICRENCVATIKA